MLDIVFLTPSRSERCGIWTYTNYYLQAIQADVELKKQMDVNIFMDFVAFQKRIATKMPDLVHLQDEYGIVPEQILYWLRDKKIPYVVTMHTIWANKKEHHDEFRSEYCRKIILHSEDQLKVLKRTHPELEDKCIIIPHGSFVAETDGYVPEKGKRIIFGAFGFASPAKRFIETYHSLKKSGLDFEYRVLSSYPQDNQSAIIYSHQLLELRKEARYEAEQEGIRPRFHLDNNFLQEDEIIRKLKTCDILLSSIPPIIAPSVSGSSRFLMRAARPVIVSDTYHYSDVPSDTFIKIHSMLPPAHYQEATEQIFKDYQGFVERMKAYTESTSWALTAKQHFSLYCNAVKK